MTCQCPEECGLQVPKDHAKPERTVYVISENSDITCDGEIHFLNASRGRRIEAGWCLCGGRP